MKMAALLFLLAASCDATEIYQDTERLGVYQEEAVVISSDPTDDLTYTRVHVPSVNDGHVLACFKKRAEVKIHCIYLNDKTSQVELKDVLTDHLDM